MSSKNNKKTSKQTKTKTVKLENPIENPETDSSDDTETEKKIISKKKNTTKKEESKNTESFPATLFNKSCIITLFGKSNSGKSYLTRYLVHQALLSKKFKQVIVFCPTKFNNDFDFLPDECLVEGYDEEFLSVYLSNLKAYAEKHKKIPPASLLIFDDVIGDLKQTDLFEHFCSTFRHYGCSMILSSQLCSKGVGTVLRTQSNYSFIFRQFDLRQKKSIWENFGNMMSEKDYYLLLDEMTSEDHRCMFVNRDMKTIDDVYKSFKAPASYPKAKVVFKKKEEKKKKKPEIIPLFKSDDD